MKPYRQPRSDSFKYAIHIRANVSITSIGRDEPMSDEELDAFRRLLNKQFADEAIERAKRDPSTGTEKIPHVSHMAMYNQRTGNLVASANMPMFEVA